jgi:hypothetical protein
MSGKQQMENVQSESALRIRALVSRDSLRLHGTKKNFASYAVPFHHLGKKQVIHLSLLLAFHEGKEKKIR